MFEAARETPLETLRHPSPASTPSRDLPVLVSAFPARICHQIHQSNQVISLFSPIFDIKKSSVQEDEQFFRNTSKSSYGRRVSLRHVFAVYFIAFSVRYV